MIDSALVRRILWRLQTSWRLLRPHLGGPGPARGLPPRVTAILRQHEAESERLIGWAQLVLASTLAALYLIAPRPADAHATMQAPVPLALMAYLTFTVLKLELAYRKPLPGWLLNLSIAADTALLFGLIWSFHVQYAQPAAFSLKVPTFIYIFVFLVLHGLRFDHRPVIIAGLCAAFGWMVVVALAILRSEPETITHNFVAYISGNGILIGAEFDKIFAILMVTGLVTVTVLRAQHTLVTAIREETAAREIRRFLSSGVADAIAQSATLIEAGHAVEREAAVLMLDIRGFTRFSTTVSPARVVEMLIGFHARIVPLIRQHGGVVDKFLGDGVMATFGAVTPSPTAAADALRALDAIMDEAQRWGADLPGLGVITPLAVNGAVAAGPVVFATLGDTERLEYTVIGQAVNLAAKLEKHNKIECTRALASWPTYALAVVQGYARQQEPERRTDVSVAGVSNALDLAVMAAAEFG